MLIITQSHPKKQHRVSPQRTANLEAAESSFFDQHEVRLPKLAKPISGDGLSAGRRFALSYMLQEWFHLKINQ
jgi:hypothetical protein